MPPTRTPTPTPHVVGQCLASDSSCRRQTLRPVVSLCRTPIHVTGSSTRCVEELDVDLSLRSWWCCCLLAMWCGWYNEHLRVKTLVGSPLDSSTRPKGGKYMLDCAPLCGANSNKVSMWCVGVWVCVCSDAVFALHHIAQRHTSLSQRVIRARVECSQNAGFAHRQDVHRW
jgi:hypothetical protein